MINRFPLVVFFRKKFFRAKVVPKVILEFSVIAYRFVTREIVLSELRGTILLEKHRHQLQVNILDEIYQQKHEDHYYLVGDHFSLLMPSIDFPFDE